MKNGNSNASQKKKKITKRWWFWVLAVLVFTCIVGPFLEDDAEESPAVNPLDVDLSVGDVMNGTGDTKLGEYGYINITKNELKTITQEQLQDFANNNVNGSGYNWVSIICDDETGLCFTGSNIQIISYGKLDSDGAILETKQDIFLGSDGTYSLDQ